MRTMIFLVLVAISVALPAQQKFVVKMKLDGADREFIVVKPSGVAPPTGYPVVFMFHGTSGDGEKFYNLSGWKEKGESEKFLTVFPSSLEYCVLNDLGNPSKTTKWNCGDLLLNVCPGVPQDLKDDVKFVRKMVDTIKTSFNVNPKKIFASGFSNGGVFVNKLANEASDIFAAIAGAAGPLFSQDSSKPLKPIRLWNTVGTLDDRFTELIGISPLPFGGDSILPFVKLINDKILVCQGLSDTYTKNYTSLTNTFIYQTPEPGNPATISLYSLVKDLTHEYANGINHPLRYTDIFWPFFNPNSTANSELETTTEPQLSLYPNPATDEIIVDPTQLEHLEDYSFTVVNSLGQQLAKLGPTATVLKKSDFGKGMYFLVATSKAGSFAKKFVFL